MKRTFLTAAVAVALGLSGSQLYARGQSAAPPGTGQQTPDDTINDDIAPDRGGNAAGSSAEFDMEDFVEKASAAGQAEINAAQIALEDGSQQLHGFASTLVEDHQAANEKLEEIAEENNLEFSEEAGLLDRAKSGMLGAREGEAFDRAFLDEQIEAHEESIELFQEAAESGDAEISAFATEMLSTLEEHLRRAEQLRSRVSDSA